MATLNLNDYSIEFKLLFGFRYGRYTWFLSKRNYSRCKINSYWTSDTVYIYTTDDATEYDKIGKMSVAAAIRYIKRHSQSHYNSKY